MILNKQKKVRLAKRPFEKFLRRTQYELRIPNSEITIAFVSDEDIAQWNEQYRNKKGPTDVLSFPVLAGGLAAVAGQMGPSSAKSGARAPDILGDIAIAPETARRYAHENGRTLSEELRVLMLHGVLHLMGYDHESDHGQMNRIEQKLRRRLGIA
jgi:probable rRNA maturation factor